MTRVYNRCCTRRVKRCVDLPRGARGLPTSYFTATTIVSSKRKALPVSAAARVYALDQLRAAPDQAANDSLLPKGGFDAV
jgi:hypothetical protein